MKNWHRLTVEEVAFESGTDTKNGKSELNKKNKRSSSNVIFELPGVNSRIILKHMLSDAALLLLMFTLILATFTGHAVESYSSAVLLIIAFVLGSYFKYRSSKRILNSYAMTLPTAKVIENGRLKRLSVFDVEVGDLIEFKQGDIIPADARIVSSETLRVSERSTDPSTGKTVYVQKDKTAATVISDEAERESYENTVYAGSMVVSGKGSAIVFAVGKDTKLCRIHAPISVVRENDAPGFLSSFYSLSKRTSLSVLIAVIPVTFVALYTQTINSSVIAADRYDLLYLFLIALSLSVTCMSELVISPAETLVTKDILPSSRRATALDGESRLTKLSAAENLADIDTLLILCPEVLKDRRIMVRRVYYNSTEYRLDTLSSFQLSSFKDTVSEYFSYLPKSKIDKSSNAIRSFIGNRKESRNDGTLYLNNFPISGAMSRVFKRDANGTPIDYISHSADLSILRSCTHVRTEGGGAWAMDKATLNSIIEAYSGYISAGLHPSVLISGDEQTHHTVFEGMLAVGEEFPYADGDVFSEYSESGIKTILVFPTESKKIVEFASSCGILTDGGRMAIASEYYKPGLTVNDSPADTTVYIGFGRQGTCDIVSRLKRSNHRILPIIKDSAQKHDILPITHYATHSIDSHDTTKLATSITLKPSEADSQTGGISDALRIIRGSSLARIKLGAYKNFLIFSCVSRLSIVVLPMILGFANHVMSAFSILLSGFLCDFIALIVLMYASGKPIMLKHSAAEAKRLFSGTFAFLYAGLGAIASLISVFMSIFLTESKALPLGSASTFLTISLVGAQLSALAGLLLILRSKTRDSRVNYVYLISLFGVVTLVYLLTVIPEDISVIISHIGLTRLDAKLLPYALPASLIVLLGSLIINKLISVFSTRNR